MSNSLDQVNVRRLLDKVKSDLAYQCAKAFMDEITVAELKDTMSKYLENLSTRQALLPDHSVLAGSVISTIRLKAGSPTPSYRQKHQASVVVSGGVAHRTKIFKGKWRKVKAKIRQWFAHSKQCLYTDVMIKPVKSVDYITVSLLCQK